MNNEKIMATTLEDLSAYKKGALVRLPDFAENQPFVAYIKRPSVLNLIKLGKIPNELIVTANELFTANGEGKLFDMDDSDAMKNMFEIFDVICSVCFIEPSYEEIKEIGIELTDEQMMFIFNYSQQGVRALDSFREQQEGA